jgi:magnesium transporter
VGVFLQPDRMTVILGEDTSPFTAGREFREMNSLTSVFLRFLVHTTRHYLDHLKAIKQLTGEIERKLSFSMENRYLLQMFSLSESLIYYLSALESNVAVLKRLQANANRVGLSAEERETMDDIIIEHDQCRKQTEIYSSVLSGLMDARGNIINNNMNVLLKNLTLISVVFLPLNLIASIGGMSEFSMMTEGIDWRISYSLFMLTMMVLGWVTWTFLIRKIERGNGKSRAARKSQPQFAESTSIGL